MKNIKKLCALIGAAVMTVSLAACGNTSDTSGTESAREVNRQPTERPAENTVENMTENTAQNAEENMAESTEVPAEEGRSLVAYFSYTGNTAEVAAQIADYTGGTLAEIQRAQPYDDVNTEGEEELNSNARPEITVDLDSIDEYETVFIGYPIWWDEAPMVISTFLESYDFSGKTIVPFCTSASDSIDNSLHIFNELAPDAEIAEGLTANNNADIEPWLNRLGFTR